MAYNFTATGQGIEGVSDSGEPTISLLLASVDVTGVSKGWHSNTIKIGYKYPKHTNPNGLSDHYEILYKTGMQIDGVVASDLDGAIVKLSALVGTFAVGGGGTILSTNVQYNSDALAISVGGLIAGQYYPAGDDHVDGVRQGTPCLIN